MNEHIVSAFDADLAVLSGEVARVGSLALEEVQDSLAALARRDTDLAQDVVARDRALDALQLEIEERAIRLVALRQPVAIDLRRAMAAMKMASELERCGDLGKNIAKRTIILSEGDIPSTLMRSLERMGKLVAQRLEQAIGAYETDDLIVVAEVWTRDQEIDQAYESLFRELLTYMMGDARLITVCTHLLFVAKNLERIGDHATNIAEIVHYTVTGDQLTARPKL